MKKAGLFFIILLITLPVAIAQKNDSIGIPEEVGDSSAVIISDDDNGVSVNMDEIVKEAPKDTTKIKIGDKNINIIVEEEDGDTSIELKDGDDEEKPKLKKFKGHWSGFELGLNNFVDDKFNMSRTPETQFMDLNTGRSWNVNLNFYQVSLGLIGNRFGLVSGLGIDFNNYQFDGNNSIEDVNGITVSKEFPDVTLTKSKLTTTFLNVPLLLEVQIGGAKRSKRIHLAGGVIGGLKLGSHTKIVYREDGKKKKEKDQDDFNINPLRYGITARLGYRNIELYGNYYPTSFFEKDKGPELYPYCIGLSFGL